jgi:pilus assembly protein Flp/PilA
MDVLPPQLRDAAVFVAAWLRLGRDERGASAVEYGLMVAGIAAVIVAAVFALGQGVLANLFTSTCNSIGQNLNGNNC